ncbi:hypothetical protein GLYMA_16G147400v4 [Glycine max]|uniref:TIR domain-containing protein n=1 Tax=Glycine max TaxID=3847 RepID=A0A0R0FZH9_SOYBN|nr:hypothetical protein GLYMA_16G147400v4 [Glycine max]
MQPSSSSFGYGFTYDVFLSFRGEDTRYGFTGNLYKALYDKGIHTFIDEELQRGDKITSTLEKAIQDYASSPFCLNELAYILNFIKGNRQLVLPVFHNVDTSHVRHHTGSFEQKNNVEKLDTWKMALHQAASLSGYHFKHGDGYEYQFINRIVELVSSKINRVPLHVADYPVGLESPMLEVKSLLLDVGSDDVILMVGIQGLGGVGKTTLAVAVYNSIADNFEALCYLENSRETSNKHGILHLQSNLLSETIGEKEIKLTSVKQGISVIQHSSSKRTIVGRPDWFGPGSRVIINTRDKHLLACHGKDVLQLLSWKAFKSEEVDRCFEDVLNRAVTYALGLPLALEVIGFNLFGKSIKQWGSALNRYERIPNKKSQEILKVSYDALEKDEQSIFLDIVCCFKEYELAEVEDIIHAHLGNCMKHHIEVLVEKSLIKISLDGKVILHDWIEDMGKEIVRKESSNEPGNRSRLWFPKDIYQIEIEIIFMDCPLFEEVKVEWDGDAFKKMKNLRTLTIRSGLFSKGPKHLPNTYCFTSLGLTSFLLKKASKLVNLTSLNFDMCQCLTPIPDVSCLPQLEELSIRSCQNLFTIHHSMGSWKNLKS